jgi:hypothetical protein
LVDLKTSLFNLVRGEENKNRPPFIFVDTGRAVENKNEESPLYLTPCASQDKILTQRGIPAFFLFKFFFPSLSLYSAPNSAAVERLINLNPLRR